MEGVRKTGRPRKRWRGKLEEDLSVKGIKNGQTIARDGSKWRKILLEGKGTDRT